MCVATLYWHQRLLETQTSCIAVMAFRFCGRNWRPSSRSVGTAQRGQFLTSSGLLQLRCQVVLPGYNRDHTSGATATATLVVIPPMLARHCKVPKQLFTRAAAARRAAAKLPANSVLLGVPLWDSVEHCFCTLVSETCLAQWERSQTMQAKPENRFSN